MKYADATRCPDCRAVLEGRLRCAVCGFDVQAPEVLPIWERLEQIDELIATARARVVVPPPIPTVPTPPPAADAPSVPGFASPPVLTPAPTGPPLASGVSAGSVILGLGAALLVLAAVIFVSFAWSVLGIGGRAAILALLTALVAAAGGWALRRGLRGSTEALWLVFAGFVSADWFAACGLGLLGLDGLSGWQVTVPWLVLLSVSSAVVGSLPRRLADRPVLTLEVAAGLALVPAVVTIGDALAGLGVRAFWLLGILTVLAAAVGVGALVLRQHVWSAVAAVAAAATGAAMLVAAVVEAAVHPELGEYVGHAHGLPLLLVTALAAGSAVWGPVRAASVAASTLLVTLLVALPLTPALDGQAWFLWVTVVVVVVAALRLGPRVAHGPVGAGLLVAGGTLTVLVATGWASGLAPVAAALGESLRGPQDLAVLQATRDLTTAGRLVPWIAQVGGAGLVVLLATMSRWPDAPARRAGRHLVVLAGLVAAATIVAVLAENEAPVLVLGLVTLVAGVVLAVAARWSDAAWGVGGLALVALAPVFVVPTWDGLVVVAAVCVVVLLALAVVPSSRGVMAWTASSAGAGWIVLLTLIAVNHPDVALAARPATTLVLVVALLLVVVGTAVQQAPVTWRPGLAMEIVGAVVVGLSLAVGAVVADAAWLAAWCTGSGVTAVAVGLLVPGRRWARWAGAVLLGLAWILRLAASDVRTVEAYTVPFAVVAVVAGVLALRRDGSLRTFTTLGAGLVLGLLPSTLVALTDPVSLRALLVGVVGLLLLVGGLLARWQAPFVLGGGALLLIAVVELAPYGWALPRWVLIGVAGLLLLLGGITWESRVRDGRAVARFVRSMR
ncbi:MAG: hypothetical protein P1U38_10700 [Aeromicrobium sp.]|uniref:SCO7613 C-terminal domain-containing membrane protein n=1 Tax=Aeromicrobium sp. TaxID=1871063 RepID=UPI0026052903|nr:hypothetical protein [Aeromicrobium sp.]MDF1705233.1 hypothetical protein [Aeromicrobium sp.]